MTTPTTTPADLLPCPFCGAGETVLHVNKGTWNGQGYGEPVSIEIRHWCPQEPGQPSRPILRIGRDEGSAIAAWNRRATPSPGKADAEDAERIDYTLTRGDIAYSSHWGEGRSPVEVVDVNWALRAIAVRLAPNKGIVVWPASSLHRERDKQ